ncbi:unnamed protein product [Scytosiphon promiscuus]
MRTPFARYGGRTRTSVRAFFFLAGSREGVGTNEGGRGEHHVAASENNLSRRDRPVLGVPECARFFEGPERQCGLACDRCQRMCGRAELARCLLALSPLRTLRFALAYVGATASLPLALVRVAVCIVLMLTLFGRVSDLRILFTESAEV